MEELIGSARLFSSAHGGGVGEYLDQVSLLTNLDNLDETTDRVTLMTAHNAKGLEFPHVFVCGLEEGLFPHVSAFEDDAEMEEERRLFYVASTRAMDRLTLSASLLRRRFNTAAGGVSRFMSEVDPALYEETELTARWSPGHRGSSGGGWRSRGGLFGSDPRSLLRESPAAARPCAPHRAAGQEVDSFGGPTDSLEHPLVGRRVFHATFGPGIVVAADGKGDRARVTVRFHSGQTRKVIGGYLEWEA